MGGVPRHKACKKCTLRRVKCDESRPCCHTCIRLGFSCPGYEDGQLTWRDESIRIRKKHEPQSSSLDVAVKRSKPKWRPESSSNSSSGLNITPSLPYHLYRIVNLHPFANSHVSPSAASLIRTMDSAMFVGLRPISFESYIAFIPSRLGHNAALDDAVDCLTTLYSTTFMENQSAEALNRSKYVQALSSLRKCLYDKDVALASETLCATLLLGIYEVLANFHGSMLRHMHGASDLIRARGPQRHVEPFERAMLLAAQGSLSTESIAIGSTSSLDSKVWRNLIAQRPPDSSLEEDRACQKLKFMDDLSIPQLMQNLLVILRSEQNNMEEITNVLNQATRFRCQFLTWAQAKTSSKTEKTEYMYDEQVLANTQEVLHTVQLLATALSSSMVSCSNLDIGAYGNYYGMMILINRVVLCLGEYRYLTSSPAFFGVDTNTFTYLQALEEENKQLASMAIKTERFLGTNRPLCLLYYKFSLHVAKATLSTTEDWSKFLNFRHCNRVQSPLREELNELNLIEEFLSLLRLFSGI